MRVENDRIYDEMHKGTAGGSRMHTRTLRVSVTPSHIKCIKVTGWLVGGWQWHGMAWSGCGYWWGWVAVTHLAWLWHQSQKQHLQPSREARVGEGKALNKSQMGKYFVMSSATENWQLLQWPPPVTPTGAAPPLHHHESTTASSSRFVAFLRRRQMWLQ